MARSALVGGTLWLLAYAAWTWGARTDFGQALVAFVIPLLIIPAKWTHGRRWRVPLCQSLAFAVPACSFCLLPQLYTPRPIETFDPMAKQAQLLDALAGFLYQDAITTSAGLLVLLCTFRSDLAAVESKAFRATLTVIGLAKLSIGVPCAALFYILLRES